MASVTLFTSPTCSPCRVLKARFDRAGIDLDVIDLSTDENAELAASLKARGFSQTPIVIAGDIEFAGMIPDKIQAVIDRFGTEG